LTISPITNLPAVTDPVILDGTTQPGFAGSPLVELSGVNIPSFGGRGLSIVAGSSTVKGLIINRWTQDGLRLETGGGNVIQGNYIGTNAVGGQSQTNNVGIEIVQSNNNQIGLSHNKGGKPWLRITQ